MANCNRQQLNITCGTDVVLHDRLIFDGETFDPNLSVGIAANLVSSLGKRTALDVQVVDDELLISVPWIDGTLPGCYGLEVTGSCNSKKWATYADSLIKYTKATRLGLSDVAVESDSYDITQEIGYRYAEGGNVNDVKVNGVSVVSAGKANITMPTKTSDLQNDSEFTNKSYVDAGLSGKQDVINDLAAIRSGAAAGGTAYQKPASGIPSSDLSAEVQDMIENGGKTKSVSVNGGTPVTPDANGQVNLTIEQANVTIGTVTTGAAGSDAEVNNSGTPTAPVLNFVIPKGDDGREGPQGPHGDSVIVGEGDLPLAHVLGTSGEKAMSQKGVTDSILEAKRFEWKEINLSLRTAENWTLSNTPPKWAQGNSSNNCIFLPVVPGEVYNLVAQPNKSYHAMFLTSGTHGASGSSPALAGGLTTAPGWTLDEQTLTVPSDATHLYLRKLSSGVNQLPIVRLQKGVVDEVDNIKQGYIEKEERPIREVIRYSTSSSGEVQSGHNRLRILIDVKKGDKFTLLTTDAYKFYVALQTTRFDCLSNALATMAENYSNAYVDHCSFTVGQDGILCLAYTNGNSAYTEAMEEEILSKLKIFVETSGSGQIESVCKEKDFAVERQRLLAFRTNSTAIIDTGTVLRIVYKVYAGDQFEIINPEGYDIGSKLHASIVDCIGFSVYTCTEYYRVYSTKEHVTERIGKDGYLCIGVRSNAAISDETMATMLEEITVKVTPKSMVKEAEAINGKKLYLGNIVKKTMTATDLIEPSDVDRATMENVIAIPSEKTKAVRVKAPMGYFVVVRTGAKAQSLTRNQYWFFDGDTFDMHFADGDRFYRVAFGYAVGNDSANQAAPPSGISAEEVMRLIDSGEIALYYDESESTVEQRNSESLKKALAMTGKTTGLPYALGKYMTLTHTSDLHADHMRAANFFDFSDMAKVSHAIVTGDIVGDDHRQSSKFLQEEALKHNSHTLACIGNHDCYFLSQNSDIYDEHIAALSERFNYVEDGEPYYYYDDTKWNVRFIALHQYEDGLSIRSIRCKISQEQINWFISTLASTPQGYGVVVLMHCSPSAVESREGSSDSFNQNTGGADTMGTCGLTGEPIRKIVDAFISGGAVSGTYTQYVNAEEATTETISYEADFSEAESNEFIAYLSGHKHSDNIGYLVDGVNKQVVLNICCGIACYGSSSYPYYSNVCDFPRGVNGPCQDAFNFYAIDRENHKIKILRVGSNITFAMQPREYMEISYK